MKVNFVGIPREMPLSKEYFTTTKTDFQPQKSPKRFFLFALFVLTLSIVGYLVYSPSGDPQLSPERELKRDSAIGRTYKRNRKNENCEQYGLRARTAAWFPVLKRGEKVATDSIWLNINEIWRYGKTCNGEEIRYPAGVYYSDGKWTLTRDNLRYDIQFRGTETECLVIEKEKIYNYPVLPECIKRTKKIIRPAGNKNDN